MPLDPTQPKATFSSSTLTGTWQGRTYDPAAIRPVGVWTQVGGIDWSTILNRFVQIINPGLAKLQRSRQTPDADWINYPAFDQSDSGRPEYHESAAWFATYQNWRIVHENWAEFFQLQCPSVIDWLAPGWLRTPGPASNAFHPYWHFEAPHGLVDASRQDPDFFAAMSAREAGLDHLVDGFYEGVANLHTCGVTTCTQLGSPSANNSYKARQRRELYAVQDLVRIGRTVLGLDGCVSQDASGVDGDCARAMSLEGDGVALSGLLHPSLAGESNWLPLAVQLNLTYADDHAVVVSGSSTFPAVGTSDFNTAFANTHFFWKLAFDDFGLTFPGWSASTAAIDAYLTSYAAATTALRGAIPRSVVLLPQGLPELAASRGKLVSAF